MQFFPFNVRFHWRWLINRKLKSSLWFLYNHYNFVLWSKVLSNPMNKPLNKKCTAVAQLLQNVFLRKSKKEVPLPVLPSLSSKTQLPIFLLPASLPIIILCVWSSSLLFSRSLITAAVWYKVPIILLFTFLNKEEKEQNKITSKINLPSSLNQSFY